MPKSLYHSGKSSANKAAARPRVLLVSDSKVLIKELSAALAQDGVGVVTAGDALDAMKRVYDAHPSVVIVEDRLSSTDSIDLCSHVGRLNCIGIILLGQEKAGAQVVNGLNRGVDVYLARSVSLAEVVARVRNLLRRRRGWPEDVQRFLDVERQCVLVGPPVEGWVNLTGTEFRLLSYLVLYRDRVVPAEELLAHVWPGNGMRRSSLRSKLCKLRRKLDPAVPNAVLTQYGIGYRIGFDPDAGNASNNLGDILVRN